MIERRFEKYKCQTKRLANRLVLVSLVIFPFTGMAFLTVTVLLPSLNNPEAKFYGSGKGAPAKQRASGEAITVETVTISQMTSTQALSAPGESVAQQSIEVRSKVAGSIEAIFVEEGEQVKAGQPLIKLEQSSYLDAVRIAENNVANDEQNLVALEAAYHNDVNRLTTEIELAAERARNAESRLAASASRRQNNVTSSLLDDEIRDAAEQLESARAATAEDSLLDDELFQFGDEAALPEDDLFLSQLSELGEDSYSYREQDNLLWRQLTLERAQLALERTVSLYPQRYEKLQLRLQTRQAQLREAERQLARTVITAPVDSLTSRIFTNVGEIVRAGSGDPLMHLSGDVVFKAFVDQANLNQVVVDDMAAVRLTAYPGKIFAGKVVRVNSTIETDSIGQKKVGVDRQYTYSVWIEIADLKMPPGLQGYAQFEKDSTALGLPENGFLHLSNGEGMVMVVEDNYATPRSVKVGTLQDNRREIVSGLEPGEQVILNPQAIQPGDLVTISET